MSEAIRPYLSAGMALATAGVLAAAPVVAPPDSHLALTDLDVTLTAVTDAVTPYIDLVGGAFTNITDIAGTWLGNPMPVLTSVLGNQLGYGEDVVNLITGLGSGYFTALTDLPDQLSPVFSALAALDFTGASAALQTAMGATLLLPALGSFTELQNVLTIPQTIAQNVANGFEAATGQLLTVGLGALLPLYAFVDSAGTSAQAIVDGFTGGSPIDGFAAAVGAPGEILGALITGQGGLLDSEFGIFNSLVNVLPDAIGEAITNPGAFSLSGLGDLGAGLPDFGSMISSVFDGLNFGDLGLGDLSGLLDNFGFLPDLFMQIPTMLMQALLG